MYQDNKCNKVDVTDATDESTGYNDHITDALACVFMCIIVYIMCYIGFALDVAGGYER